ncbi:MAG TPA: hypothetical protein VIJ63_10425 [Roseiarcus sp.]
MRIPVLSLLILTASPAFGGSLADSDSTPVPMCDQMSGSAVFEGISADDAKAVCRAMGLLDGVRVEDIRTFSKAAFVLAREGYVGNDGAIAKQLVQIVRLRGLYDKPERWYATVDIVVRTYQAFNGVVTPIDVIDFLGSSGTMRKTLSDDGFRNMLIVLKEIKQQSDN